jgi:hypothetical protein
MYRLFKDTVVYQFWQAFRTKNSWEPPDATAKRLDAGPACFINARCARIPEMNRIVLTTRHI